MTAIVFDMDDTLYDQVVPFQQAVEKIFPHITRVSADSLFRARSYHGEVSFHMVRRGEMTMEEMYRYRTQKAFEEFGICVTDDEADAFQQAYADCQQRLVMSETMKQMLAYCLEKQTVMGIITNGPSAHQRAKARALSVESYIPADHIIVSGEAGFVKPDVRIFRLAEKRLGLALEAADVWYIGDSFEHDITGAKQAGWKTIWLNRRKKPLPAAVRMPNETGQAAVGKSASLASAAGPDRCVYTDEELFGVIREIL